MGPAGTADWYRNFGTVDAPASSPCYAEWSLGIADDPELLHRIEQWPHNKRQPLLILAAARYLGAGVTPYREFREFLLARWDDVSRIVLSRATQTNETGRCATLLPSLAAIAASTGRPLALIEVAPPPAWPCFRTSTPMSTTTAHQSRGWFPNRTWPGSRRMDRPFSGARWKGPSPFPPSSPRSCGGRG